MTKTFWFLLPAFFFAVLTFLPDAVQAENSPLPDQPGQQEVSDSSRPLPADMVFIPGGECQMGSSSGDAGYADERPLHTVRISPFYMGRHEITNEQFCAFLNSALSDGHIRVTNGVALPAGLESLHQIVRTKDGFKVQNKGGTSDGQRSGVHGGLAWSCSLLQLAESAGEAGTVLR